jgi:dGTPase
MDWADDVAYSVHDVEDGVHGGLIRLVDVSDEVRETLCRIAAAEYSPHRPEELAPVLDELLAQKMLRDLAGYDGSYTAQAAAKRATSELTGRFVSAAVAATRECYGFGPLARYSADLVVPEGIVAECALLKAVAAHFVMRRRGIAEQQSRQRRLLRELAEAVAAGAPETLDRALRPAWEAASSDAARLRTVVDQVAQLTDSSAVTRHARLLRRD